MIPRRAPRIRDTKNTTSPTVRVSHDPPPSSSLLNGGITVVTASSSPGKRDKGEDSEIRVGKKRERGREREIERKRRMEKS